MELKKPLETKPIFKIIPDKLKAIRENKCTTCGKPLVGDSEEFRDELSRREYSISGMCQACQDSMFGVA